MEDHERWVEVYHGIEVLEIPQVISRAEGEQHPEGNPHYNVGPQCGPMMAENVAAALAEADPLRADFYLANGAQYRSDLENLADSLKTAGSDLRGVTIVSYHPDVAYLAAFYGMQVVGSLEPKAGIEPSAGHLAQLARQAEAAGAELVIYHQAQSGRLPAEFASRIGAVAVQFANMVGAKKEIKTFRQLQEHNLEVLLAGLQEAGRAR
jgi:zinc/manganese transport system substrate-binding protein